MKTEIKEKLHHLGQDVFTGRHSVIIVVGFTVGGTLMARSLWQYLFDEYGLAITMLVGLFIFVLSGIYMHKFYDIPSGETDDTVLE